MISHMTDYKHSKWRILLQRLRQRQLAQAEWLHYFYENHFTAMGKALLLATICSLSLGFSGLELPLYILALHLTGLFAAVLLQGYWHRPRSLTVDVVSLLPVMAGHSASLLLQVRYQGRMTLYNLEFYCVFKGPNDKRWQTTVALATVLQPGQSLPLRLSLPLLPRGEYRLVECLVYSSFPFHLLKWRSLYPLHQTLLVYPHYKPLHYLELKPGRKFQVGGIYRQEHQGEAVEFVGIRQFAAGDNPRHVHWPSLAKTGKLHVKEFHEEYFVRLALFLDLAAPHSPAGLAQFENSLSVLAALADWVLRCDYHLDLCLLHDQARVFGYGGGSHIREQLLGLLARVQPVNQPLQIEQLTPFEPELKNCSLVIGVLQQWLPSHHSWVRHWQQQGIICKFWLPDPRDIPSDMAESLIPLPVVP